MGILWNRSGSFEFDANGDPAPGATASFFAGGTTTPLVVYQDADEATPHTNPVEADGNGRWPAVFIPFTESYDVQVETAGGTELYYYEEIPNPDPVEASEDSVDEDALYQTGDYIFVGKNGTRNGAVRCNGRTIGNAASSATERAHADTADLFAYLWNNYANGQAAVSGGRGASAAADFAAGKRIDLPDHRGVSIVGFDDMGNTARNALTGVPVTSGSAIIAGSLIGENVHTLTSAEMPAHTHSFSATTGAGGSHTHSFSATTGTESAGHTHGGTTDSGGVDHTHGYSDSHLVPGVAGGGLAGSQIQDGDQARTTGGASAFAHTHAFTTGGASATHTHSVSGTTGAEASHTHSVSGTTGSTGSGGSHNTVSASIPVTVLMKL